MFHPDSGDLDESLMVSIFAVVIKTIVWCHSTRTFNDKWPLVLSVLTTRSGTVHKVHWASQFIYTVDRVLETGFGIGEAKLDMIDTEQYCIIL